MAPRSIGTVAPLSTMSPLSITSPSARPPPRIGQVAYLKPAQGIPLVAFDILYPPERTISHDERGSQKRLAGSCIDRIRSAWLVSWEEVAVREQVVEPQHVITGHAKHMADAVCAQLRNEVVADTAKAGHRTVLLPCRSPRQRGDGPPSAALS
jgi:hypothetical protein